MRVAATSPGHGGGISSSAAAGDAPAQSQNDTESQGAFAENSTVLSALCIAWPAHMGSGL